VTPPDGIEGRSEDGTKQYRVKSKDEAYERVVAESDLVVAAMPNFDAD
jgi:hypothetical protein